MTTPYVPSGHPCGNVLMIRDGYKVSFNPSPGMGLFGMGADDGGSETAILVAGEFFILNGDFREVYAGLESLEDCLKFFASKPDLVSSWSGSVEDAIALCGVEP